MLQPGHSRVRLYERGSGFSLRSTLRTEVVVLGEYFTLTTCGTVEGESFEPPLGESFSLFMFEVLQQFTLRIEHEPSPP